MSMRSSLRVLVQLSLGESFCSRIVWRAADLRVNDSLAVDLAVDSIETKPDFLQAVAMGFKASGLACLGLQKSISSGLLFAN